MLYEITDETFEQEVAASDIPCVILFTSGWCTFCDEMAPVLEGLSEQLEGQVKCCIVNIDELKALRIKFAVAALPYVVWVQDRMKSPLFDCIVPAAKLEDRIRFMLENGEAPTTRPL